MFRASRRKSCNLEMTFRLLSILGRQRYVTSSRCWPFRRVFRRSLETEESILRWAGWSFRFHSGDTSGTALAGRKQFYTQCLFQYERVGSWASFFIFFEKSHVELALNLQVALLQFGKSPQGRGSEEGKVCTSGVLSRSSQIQADQGQSPSTNHHKPIVTPGVCVCGFDIWQCLLKLFSQQFRDYLAVYEGHAFQSCFDCSILSINWACVPGKCLVQTNIWYKHSLIWHVISTCKACLTI